MGYRMKMKKIVKTGILAVLVIFYLARVIDINRDISHSKVTYVPDTESVAYDGMEVSMVSHRIYEMPAFVETHPGMEEFYHISTNFYAKSGDIEGFRSLKYVVGVKLAFYNASKEEKEVYPADFQLFNKSQTISQGVDPQGLEALNGAMMYKLSPGERKEVELSYDLFGAVIRDLSYKKIRSEDFGIMISGYPRMQAIQLEDSPLVKAKGEFDPYDQGEEGGVLRVEKEDTLSGTILPVGGECITGGVGVTVEGVDIVRNVKEFPNYQEDAWVGYFKERFLNKDGTVDTVWEEGHGLPKSYYEKGYQNYIIFVTLKFRNYTNRVADVYNAYGLYDSKASWDCPSDAEYTTNLFEKDEEDAFKGIIQAGGEQVLVLGYARSIRKDKNIYETPLYISNDASQSDCHDLDRGECGFGKFIRIQ